MSIGRKNYNSFAVQENFVPGSPQNAVTVMTLSSHVQSVVSNCSQICWNKAHYCSHRSATPLLHDTARILLPSCHKHFPVLCPRTKPNPSLGASWPSLSPRARGRAKAASKAPLGSAAVRQEGTVPPRQLSCSKEVSCSEKGLWGLGPAPCWLQAGLLGFWASSFPPSLQPPGSTEPLLPAAAVVSLGSGKQ